MKKTWSGSKTPPIFRNIFRGSVNEGKRRFLSNRWTHKKLRNPSYNSNKPLAVVNNAQWRLEFPFRCFRHENFQGSSIWPLSKLQALRVFSGNSICDGQCDCALYRKGRKNDRSLRCRRHGSKTTMNLATLLGHWNVCFGKRKQKAEGLKNIDKTSAFISDNKSPFTKSKDAMPSSKDDEL